MLCRNERLSIKYIMYHMLFYLILSVLTILELLKLYVKYRIFIYLNNTPNKAYLWLANLMLIHLFIEWIFACLKARDYYLIYKNKRVKQY